MAYSRANANATATARCRIPTTKPMAPPNFPATKYATRSYPAPALYRIIAFRVAFTAALPA